MGSGDQKFSHFISVYLLCYFVNNDIYIVDRSTILYSPYENLALCNKLASNSILWEMFLGIFIVVKQTWGTSKV